MQRKRRGDIWFIIRYIILMLPFILLYPWVFLTKLWGVFFQSLCCSSTIELLISSHRWCKIQGLISQSFRCNWSSFSSILAWQSFIAPSGKSWSDTILTRQRLAFQTLHSVFIVPDDWHRIWPCTGINAFWNLLVAVLVLGHISLVFDTLFPSADQVRCAPHVMFFVIRLISSSCMPILL